MKLTVYTQPDFDATIEVHNNVKNEYVNSYTASSAIGISNNLFSRITGSILVIAGARRSNLPENIHRSNIGLQLKFNKTVSVVMN